MKNDAYPWIVLFIIVLLLMLILSVIGFDHWSAIEGH